MSLLFLKLSEVAICAFCKLIGELCWHNAQRFVMPVLLGIGISIISHTWWLGITTLPTIGVICLGYKNFGPSDGFDRGMWLFLIAFVIGIGPSITGHFPWYLYLPYVVTAGAWGGITRLWNNLIIAPISGAILGSVVFLIR